jgi:hypothetical protein
VALDPGGNLYVLDCVNSAIRKITPAGAVTTMAVDTAYRFANNLTVDNAGNVCVINLINEKIHKITASGIISVLAGNGVRGFRRI